LVSAGKVTPTFFWPYWESSVDAFGFYPFCFHGLSEWVLPLPVQYVVALLVGVTAAGLCLEAARGGLRARLAEKPALTFLLVFAFANAVVIYFASFAQGRIDRYLLPVAFLPGLVCLRLLQSEGGESRGPRVPVGAVLLAVFAVYGWAGMHDVFAVCRAYRETLDRMVAAGIPREQIATRIEIDGAYELERTGHVNNPRIQTPPNAFRPLTRPLAEVESPFSTMSPSLTPRFFILRHREESMADVPNLTPVYYWSALPPFRHALYVQALTAAPTPPARP
jgi:hypothetical protein